MNDYFLLILWNIYALIQNINDDNGREKNHIMCTYVISSNDITGTTAPNGSDGT